MFQRLTIKNFKSLKDITLDFAQFTTLIGENSCGKSTVLQGIDLLSSLAQRDIDEYLKDKGWTFEDIKSQFSSDKSDPISFIADIFTKSYHLEWTISINYDAELWNVEENLFDLNNGYQCVFNDLFFKDFAGASLKPNLKSSYMKLFS